MNQPRKIYDCSKVASVPEQPHLTLATPPKPTVSILKRIADFFKTHDLDLATFERLEGISRRTERDAFQQWRDFGGRF